MVGRRLIAVEGVTLVIAHIVAVTKVERRAGLESAFFTVYLANSKPWVFVFDGSRVAEATTCHDEIIRALAEG